MYSETLGKKDAFNNLATMKYHLSLLCDIYISHVTRLHDYMI